MYFLTRVPDSVPLPVRPSSSAACSSTQAPLVKQEYYEFSPQNSLIETLMNDDWYGGKSPFRTHMSILETL